MTLFCVCLLALLLCGDNAGCFVIVLVLLSIGGCVHFC